MKAILGRNTLDQFGNVTSQDWVTRLQNHLLDFLNGDKAAQGTKLRMQDLIFSEKQYYIRFALTPASGAGKTKILDETTKKQVGITNFNLGQLPKFTNFAFNRMSIKYVDDAATPATINLATGWTSVRGSVDKSVANGELLINKNGSPVFENPIAPYLHDAAPTAGAISEVSHELDQIITLRENELVTIELNTAATVPSVANHVYGIEVSFIGLEVRLGAS